MVPTRKNEFQCFKNGSFTKLTIEMPWAKANGHLTSGSTAGAGAGVLGAGDVGSGVFAPLESA